MVDRLVGEKKRAQEYSVLAARTAEVIKGKLREKGLSQERGEVDENSLGTPLYFHMSADYETGVTTFELSFAGATHEAEMRYEFKDGKVKKVCHTYMDSHSDNDGERYYGEFTEEEKDELCGVNPNDPEDLPREDIFFANPLSVELNELRIVSQIINSLRVDPRRVKELVRHLSWFDDF